MKLKVTLRRSGVGAEGQDLVLTVDHGATVGAVVDQIVVRDPQRGQLSTDAPLTFRIDDPQDAKLVDRGLTIEDAGLRSGQTVSLAAMGTQFREAAEAGTDVATLDVVEGPDVGKQFRMHLGANYIGRAPDNDIRLNDPMVSKQHARISIGDAVEVVDLGSSNGVVIGDQAVGRAILRSDDTVLLGDTVVRIALVRSRPDIASGTGDNFNRSPWLDTVFPVEELELPKPPTPAGTPRIPFIPLLAPVLMGCILFAITRQLISIAFVALSPIMMVGNVVEGRRAAKRTYRADVAAFQAHLASMTDALHTRRLGEVSGRLAEQPSTQEVVASAMRHSPTLWSRRPDQRGFLDIRLGLGQAPSRTILKLPLQSDAEPALWDSVVQLKAEFASVDGVPIVAGLSEVGSVGIAGPRTAAIGTARAVVTQLCGLHSPAELVVAAVASSSSGPDWEWLKWLPHVTSDHSPLTGDHLVSSAGAIMRLIAVVDALLIAREASKETMPAVLVIVEDDAPIERSRLVELAELGPAHGVHLLWISNAVAALPAACRSFVDLQTDVAGRASVGFVAGGRRIGGVAVDVLDGASTLQFARSLAPVVDAGARIEGDSDLPRSVSLLSLVGSDLVASADAVIDRWRLSNSLPAESDASPRRRRRDNHLRAQIGLTSGQSFVLDLREQGPHALVGGTTGSGKSEFLQSWIVSMALEHSPRRVTFLFVDYKGGAAFSECVRLPHCVGLVTDLSPHLVRRALTSLNAELRYRERVLREKRAKDLLELEHRGDPDTPPSLVIVVDEFAALVAEVPEFVDGVVNVAQRGRSLGLHLILATQRPAGVIKDNLRANTNLRIALRMADEHDSVDVVGTTQAAFLDSSAPGRAMAKSGSQRPQSFQAAYVGGWTPDTPPPPGIAIEEFRFGSTVPWENPAAMDIAAEAPSGPNDLHRIVSSVLAGQQKAGLAPPRRPWLDTLAPVYDLARTPQSRTDSELIFGIRDDPARQRQEPVAFFPNRDGNMAVFGTGGSGKSGFLRTLAIVAGLSRRSGPCHVYGIDFGARGLQMLEPMPHVGAIINGDDDERIRRLLRLLRQEIDERAARYAAVRAGSIDDYRKAANSPSEPRLLLLVDGIGAFRQAYEAGVSARWFDLFLGIAGDGRQVGIHVVVSADRNAAIPTALASVIQRRLVLRMANETDYAMLGVPTDAFDATTAPGRGFIDESETQVAILGGSSNTARQSAAIAQLATGLSASDDRPRPAPIERLADRVRLSDLPIAADGRPILGLADATLGPCAFTPEGVLVVVGPPQSGKTSVLATIVLSTRRWRPGGPFVFIGSADSPVAGLVEWTDMALGNDDAIAFAKDLGGRLQAREPALDDLTIVIDSVSEFLNGPADSALQELLKACRGRRTFVVTESETASMSSSWPLLQAVKSARHGIALQPDQLDGDTVFKTSFPRMARSEFPAGRGVYVRAGAVTRVQCAIPELDS